MEDVEDPEDGPGLSVQAQNAVFEKISSGHDALPSPISRMSYCTEMLLRSLTQVEGLFYINAYGQGKESFSSILSISLHRLAETFPRG